jgi:hypothetical protein
MANASGMCAKRDEGAYNVTIWRVQGGKAFACQAGRFVDGRIVRSAGKWTSDNGLAAYHDAFVRDAGTFGGEPCTIVVTRGTDGMRDAIGKSHASAYARAARSTLAYFGHVNLPGLVSVDAIQGTTASMVLA